MKSQRMDDLTSLLASLPQDAATVAPGAGGSSLLAAALAAPNGRPGGTTPQLAAPPLPLLQPPSPGPMVTNGDTSGFVPLGQAAQGRPDMAKLQAGLDLASAARMAPRAPAPVNAPLVSAAPINAAPRSALAELAAGTGSGSVLDATAAGTGTFASAPAGAQAALGRPHHGFDWSRLAGVVGAALSSATGNNGPLNALVENSLLMRRLREQHSLQEQDKLSEPRTVGDSLLLPDGNGGYRTVYTAPDKTQPFEAYARAQGLTPGTPEYAEAVKNYRLGAWSDDALPNRLAYQAPRIAASERNTDVRADTSRYSTDQRVGASERNTDVRAGVTTRGQDLSHGDRVRGQDLTHDDRIRGQDVGAATTRGSYGYQFGSGRGHGRMGANPGGSDLVGQVYTRGNQKVQYSTKSGAYVDLATGQPVHQ